MPSISVTKAEFGFTVGVADVPADTVFTLERQQISGVVRPVRGTEEFTSTGQPVYFYDYTLLQNAPPGYRLRLKGVDGDVVTDWYSTGEFVNFGGDVLFDASIPGKRLALTVESFPSVEHGVDQDTVWVLGRRDPIVVSGVRQYAKGTLNLLTLSDDDRRALMGLVQSAHVLALSPHWPNYGFDSMHYYSVARVTETRPSPRPWEPARRWALEVQRVEPPRPEKPIVTPTDPTEPPAPGDLIWANWTDRKWVSLTTLDWRKVAGI